MVGLHGASLPAIAVWWPAASESCRARAGPSSPAAAGPLHSVAASATMASTSDRREGDIPRQPGPYQDSRRSVSENELLESTGHCPREEEELYSQ